MRRFELFGAVLLAGCASLHRGSPPPEWTRVPAAPGEARGVDDSITPLGATWRLKPAGSLDAMRSPEEAAAMAPSRTIASRLDPGLSDAVAFQAYWWGYALPPSGVLVNPAAVLLLEFPLRLRLHIRLPPRWQ